MNPAISTAHRFTVVHSLEDLPEVSAHPGHEGEGYTLPNWTRGNVGQFRATAWAYLNRVDGGAVVILNGQRFTAGNPPLLPIMGLEFDRKNAGPSGQVAALIERNHSRLRLSVCSRFKYRAKAEQFGNHAAAELSALGIEIENPAEPDGWHVFTVNGERFDSLRAAVLEACGLEADALELAPVTISTREQRRIDRFQSF